MGGFEADPFVEPVRVFSRLVHGQLYETTALVPALLDRPVEIPLSDASPAQGLVDTYGLDLSAFDATLGNTMDEADLQGPDNDTIPYGDTEQLVWVVVNGMKARTVAGVERQARFFACLSQGIIG